MQLPLAINAPTGTRGGSSRRGDVPSMCPIWQSTRRPATRIERTQLAAGTRSKPPFDRVVSSWCSVMRDYVLRTQVKNLGPFELP